MKTLRVAICIMLIVGVLAMSLSVFAVDFSDRVNSYEYLWAYYIYQFLSSIGIDVTYRDIVGYTDEVQDTIIDWVVNYIADLIEADSQPSNYSIAQWIAPWQAEYDYWGNLKYNSTMLEDMQDFAEWLKSEFSLVDNSTIVVNPVYSLGGYNLYNVNQWYNTNQNGQNLGYVNIKVGNATRNVYYFVAHITSGRITGWRYVMVSDSPVSGLNINQYALEDNGVESAVSQTGAISLLDNYSGDPLQYIYANINVSIWPDNNTPVFPGDGSYFEGEYWDLGGFLQNAKITQEGDTKVITSEIILPSDNPEYTPGDGMTIIDGVPEYSVINIDNVTVDNLPAIIAQKNIPDVGNDEDNPGFSVPWQAINGLIQYVAAPAGAIMALVNEAPIEGVIMLYALIGGMIIFGMIRIMREH